jgi:drug/metabolite transporter (DMT)-like permease
MQSQHLKGIGAMVLAVGCFSLMDASLKQLAASYSPMQVTFLRSAGSLPFIVAMSVVRAGWGVLRPVRYGLHIARGVIGVATLWLFIYAVSILSLADAYSIFLSAPLLMTALSVPMLKEHVGWRRWIAVVVGLCGVLIILKPGGSRLITLGGAAALAAAIGYATTTLMIRVLGRSDTAAATMFWQLAASTVVSGAWASTEWRAIESHHWIWIAALAITGTLGQYFITKAFRTTPAAVIAPFEYTALIYGMALDWILWTTFPSLRMLSGAAVVIGSGMFVIWREAQSRVAAPTHPARSPSDSVAS